MRIRGPGRRIRIVNSWSFCWQGWGGRKVPGLPPSSPPLGGSRRATRWGWGLASLDPPEQQSHHRCTELPVACKGGRVGWLGSPSTGLLPASSPLSLEPVVKVGNFEQGARWEKTTQSSPFLMASAVAFTTGPSPKLILSTLMHSEPIWGSGPQDRVPSLVIS